MNEEWKDVKGYDNLYQISNWGRVKSLNRKIPNTGTQSGYAFIRERILKQGIDTSGYRFVNLCNGKSQKSFMVHKLVANAFIPNPYNKPQINHKDFNLSNNRADNLEWVTAKENVQHSIEHIKKIIRHRNNKGQFINKFKYE